MNKKAELLNQLRMEPATVPPDDGSGRKWLIAVVIIALLAAAAWWMVVREPPAQVTTVIATSAVLSESRGTTVLDASGYVTARRRATVSSQITGKVREVLIEEGMVVEAGQILAYLDDTLEQAQLKLNEAQLARARTALNETRASLKESRRQRDRTAELHRRDLASQSAVDEAIAETEALEARLATGREDVQVAQRAAALQAERLDDTVIRAPFAGVVVAKAAQPGEMISPVSAGGGFTRTGICTIVDMDSLEVEVDVNEAFIDRVKVDQPVTARLDAYPDWAIPARVIAIIPTADRQKATVRVRVGLNERDQRVLPDMGIKVSFMDGAKVTPGQPLTGTAVPRSALARRDGREGVFTVADGKALWRSLSALPLSPAQVLIRSGLEPGQAVIDRPPDTLTDGDAVIAEEDT